MVEVVVQLAELAVRLELELGQVPVLEWALEQVLVQVLAPVVLEQPGRVG